MYTCLQEELQRQSAYFDVLEKTEKMEMKMDSIRQMKCTAYSCKQVSFMLFYFLLKIVYDIIVRDVMNNIHHSVILFGFRCEHFTYRPQ